MQPSCCALRIAWMVVLSATLAASSIVPAHAASPKTTLVSLSSQEVGGNANSGNPALSSDGRYVAFVSSASNLVGGDTNGSTDVFVRDRELGRTERVSVSSAEVEGFASYQPSISADGRYVAFSSGAPNLVKNDTNSTDDVFIRDRKLGKTYRVSLGLGGEEANAGSADPAISQNGRYVAFLSEASNLIVDNTDNQWANISCGTCLPVRRPV